jgi:hypothetical protein
MNSPVNHAALALVALGAPMICPAPTATAPPSRAARPRAGKGAVVRMAPPTREELCRRSERSAGRSAPRHPGLSCRRRIYNRRLIRAIREGLR